MPAAVSAAALGIRAAQALPPLSLEEMCLWPGILPNSSRLEEKGGGER